MKPDLLYKIWAGMFILCAGFSFIPEPRGFWKIFCILLSLGFFLPPALLLGQKSKSSRFHARIIRNLSLASLGLSIVLILANFMSLMASQAAGQFLYAVLAIVSTPMICAQYWVLSLFLWACLLFWAQGKLKK